MYEALSYKCSSPFELEGDLELRVRLANILLLPALKLLVYEASSS
jgi:hypothetical protein